LRKTGTYLVTDLCRVCKNVAPSLHFRVLSLNLEDGVQPDGAAFRGCLEMTDKQIILSTAGSEEEARKIAHTLVERGLAACVNIIPQIESIYRWQGKIEQSREWLLLIKTTAERFSAVRDAIRELHSYDLPECIALNIEDGSAEYLHWIENSTRALP
jgi:periplasmic divalent cation tolerance protein